jgi:type I restriction enzyme M protein
MPPPTLTSPKETATRKRVDAILNNLGWQTDERSPTCNVFTERAKTTAQHKAMKGRSPDYLLYETGTDTPIGVIETKREGESMSKALAQASERYAEPLDIAIVFVADGAIVQSFDRRHGRQLRQEGDLVTSLLSEKTLLRFVKEGWDLNTPETVRHTREELINVFAEANGLLRKEGLREGIERFTEFSNLLFLKLISEIENERELRKEPRILERRYCWESFCDKPSSDMLDYINDTILPRLVGKYNHSGDVFQRKLLIATPETLKEIVGKLSALTLLDADSDVKGDAFEYFLKNSVSVGNDLGEYFTPRHIVKLMTDLIDPVYKETVYDPACGTGGFLIQAFRHIKAKVKPTKESAKVLQEETVYGRELTGTAKIAKMNMIIIGDGHANVTQVDTLKTPVHEEYEVVLSNFPFSQTTNFAPLYGLSGANANPVFLKHIIDALCPGGRAAVVVPEGLLFDTVSQLAKVRKLLVDTCTLEAVINLHDYVFRPYTGQPTSILVFKKGGQTKDVWYFEVKEDGFEKASRKTGRRPIDENDLPLLRQLWDDKSDSDRSFSVPVDTIREHGYTLTIDEYRKSLATATWPTLGGEDGVCTVTIGGTPSTKNRANYGGKHLWATIADITSSRGLPIVDTATRLTDRGVENSSVKLVRKGTVLLSFKLSPGKTAIAGADLYTNEAIAALTPKDKRVLPEYLYYVLPRLDYSPYARKATKGLTLNKASVESIKIPLPSPAIQRKVIATLAKQERGIRAYEDRIVQLRKDENNTIAEMTGLRWSKK